MHRIVFLIAISAAVSCPADIISWTNTSGGNWSFSTNWSPNRVPGSSDDAIITAGGTYTVTLDASPTVSSLTLGGASGQQTLNTSGNNLTVNSPSTANGNGILDLSGGTLTGSFTVVGAMKWSGGSLGYDCWLTVASNGVMEILGGVNLLGFLTNSGTVNWQGGDISVYCYGPWWDFHGEIWNQAQAVWNIQCDQTLVGYGALAPFFNAGLIKKTAGTNATTLDVYLANSGEVHEESGIMWLRQGGALGGTFEADAGAAIYFTSGSFTVNGQQNFQGAGPIRIVGGQIAVNQSSGVLDIYGGDLIGKSFIGGTLNWYGGWLIVGATLTVSSNGVLNFLGNIGVAGGLTNAGTVNWQGGDLILSHRDTGEIWNEAYAVWRIQCDQTLIWQADLPTFHNAGRVEKTAGTNTTSVYAYLDNKGEVHADSGTIQFLEGGNLGGTFQADAGAAIYLHGGSYNLDNPPNFQGPGLLESTNASLIGQNIISGSTFNWDSGQLANGASLTVGKDGVLNIRGSVSVMGALTNAGKVNWQSGAVRVFGTAIWNDVAGVWNIQCDQDIGGEYGNEQFYNAGLIEKTASTKTTSFTVYLDNSGTVEADTGTMSFQGGYSDSSSANLLLSIGGTAPGDEYGHISFSTPLAANGTLSVSTRNGFLPSPGESFKLLSYPAATNNFGCLVGLDLGGGILLQPEFRSGNLALLARAYTTNAHMPQLFISPALGGMAIIIWPVGLSDWSLQSATNLSWHACLPVPITCSNQALVPNNTLQQYFRLQQNN